MEGLFNYHRRQSGCVRIGNTPLGGENPIRIQSMATVSTMDTERAVEQAIRLADAGAEYVRFTTQGEREARNLGVIRQVLRECGVNVPLIADVHFNPKVADVAATLVEKVRINPGNYAPDIGKIRERFVPFLKLCKEHRTAIRIGVNHGSLSDRIMSRYGDTPVGMVESCMEFLEICREEDFRDVVLSIKASNVVVMVQTVRLLVQRMEERGFDFPMHLGVTEAGDGEDGRIKSAIGIGTLLADGIGDTIRVSLSEEPEKELPVARAIVEYITQRAGHLTTRAEVVPDYDYIKPTRRMSRVVGRIGGGNVPAVVAAEHTTHPDASFQPDYQLGNNYTNINFIRLSTAELTDSAIETLENDPTAVLVLSSNHPNPLGDFRAAFHQLMLHGCDVPVVIERNYNDTDPDMLRIKAAIDLGPLLLDGFQDGILIHADHAVDCVDSCMFSILQASRLRISKTEYISCPGCGRTLYDLQSTIAHVKAATSHLKGLKIGIMGCIVNGPGEMADADYGYVGAGRGRINLYKGKNCALKNIPEEQAVDELVALIRENGDWQEA